MRFRPDAPLFDRGYVCGMVVQHEHEHQHQHQHDETMLATDQLRRGAPVLPADDPPPPDPGPIPPAEVRVPAGPFLMGTPTEAWAYDNERPHTGVRLPAYWIDTVPVSNAAYRSFVDAGATTTRGGWHPDGWTWRCTSGQRAPSFWLREGGRWLRRRFARVETLPAEEPVQQVCWYDADAYARLVGERLPTEAERGVIMHFPR